MPDLKVYLSLVQPVHIWSIFALTLIYAAVMSWILLYHWQQFGTGSRGTKIAEVVYTSVTLALILVLGLLAGAASL